MERDQGLPSAEQSDPAAGKVGEEDAPASGPESGPEDPVLAADEEGPNTADPEATGRGEDADGADLPDEEAAAEPDPAELLRQERDDFHERWIRTVAELDNVRKRARREVDDARRFIAADILRDLLEILDNLERALAANENGGGDQPDPGAVVSGVQLIYQRFQEILTDRGLRKIEALDQQFDPNLHEAIQQVEADGVPAGQITAVIQEGYRFNDLVLRPSRVVVAK